MLKRRPAAHPEAVVVKSKIMEIQSAINYKESVLTLLKAEKLLTEDLPETLENFVIAMENDEVVGAAGLELYDDCGLLRSVVVRADQRNKGIANELVKAIETLAVEKGSKSLFLLTETVPGYFQQKGFSRLTREQAPESLHASSEFSYACPQSAIVMKKSLL